MHNFIVITITDTICPLYILFCLSQCEEKLCQGILAKNIQILSKIFYSQKRQLCPLYFICHLVSPVPLLGTKVVMISYDGEIFWVDCTQFFGCNPSILIFLQKSAKNIPSPKLKFICPQQRYQAHQGDICNILSIPIFFGMKILLIMNPIWETRFDQTFKFFNGFVV